MFATNPRLVGKERREHTVQATPPVVARRGVAQPPGRALAAHITTQGGGGTFSNSASRATLRQRLDHESPRGYKCAGGAPAGLQHSWEMRDADGPTAVLKRVPPGAQPRARQGRIGRPPS